MTVSPLPGRQEAKLRRYRRICRAARLHPLDRILDVGCGSGASFEAFNRQNDIVGLDLAPEPRIHQPNFRYLQGDASDMSCFADGEFDVAVAVGLMEHIAPEALRAVAGEVQRVARRYAVVIPHIWTIVEPHYRMPLWQLYPDAMKSFLVSRFKIGPYPKSPNGAYRPLNYFPPAAWRALFPGSRTAVHDHIGWLVRDLIVYGESPVVTRERVAESAVMAVRA